MVHSDKTGFLPPASVGVAGYSSGAVPGVESVSEVGGDMMYRIAGRIINFCDLANKFFKIKLHKSKKHLCIICYRH